MAIRTYGDVFMIDVLVIGGGPAGLTAAVYAARAGKTVTLCEQESFGGQIAQAHQVDNYPALPGVSGMELGDRLCAQAMDAGASVEFTGVTALSKESAGTFTVQTDDGEMKAKAVIFAAGAKPRPMGVEREQELVGLGVGYCALCDGAFFKDKDVAVVGGGNTAFSDALFLSSICKSVTLIHRRAGFRAEQPLIEAANNAENIRILTPYTVESLVGQNKLEALKLTHRETGETVTIPADGVFVALGRVPDCSLIEAYVDLDPQGFVAAGEDCRTKTPGLYVAGDCRSKAVRQLTTAVADGTVAATLACEDLK